MKADIHPTYYPDSKIVCACGAVMLTGSTVKEIHVELCSNCHPFYTGKQKLIDSSDPVITNWYRDSAKRRDEELSRLLARSGVDTVKIRVDQSYVQPLMNLFKRRGAR